MGIKSIGKWLLPAAVIAGIIYFIKKTPGNGGNGNGTVPSWITVPANISASNLTNLKTYPKNPYQKMILVSHPTQGTAWIYPQTLAAYIKPIGEWAVLPYPYSS